MKRIIILLGIMFASIYSFAGTPPEAVKKTFMDKYPGVAKVSWGKENATEWEAEFTFKGEKLSANFKEDGTWVETEHKITFEQLPKAVAEVLKKSYADWKIVEVDKTETAKNGLIYEADLKKGKEKKTAAYKEDGTVVME